MAAHRNRLRVRVRSCVDNLKIDGLPFSGKILRYVSENIARQMIGENRDGSEFIGEDGKPVVACAFRLTRPKQPLTDIRLMAPERGEKSSPCTITLSDTVNNAFGQAFSQLGPTDSIRALQRAENKVTAWPEIHDDKNTVISAGVAYGVCCVWPPDSNQLLNFA